MRKSITSVELTVIAAIFILLGLFTYGTYLNQTDMAERDPAAYDRYTQCIKLGGAVSHCAAAATMPPPPPEAPAAPVELVQPDELAEPTVPSTSPAPATP